MPKPHPKAKPHATTSTTTLPPKVGSTTTTTKTVGNTTTITKTTVVGSTSTSIQQPTTSNALPTASYTIGSSFASSGSSALAAFDALWTTRHETPPMLPVAIETASVPWLPSTTWAVVPEGIPDPANSGRILWFGESTTPDHWLWIPSDTANPPNPKLPVAMADTLQWADDLALNVQGPSGLGGMHPWSAVTGTVTLPQGWSFVSYDGSVNAWVWDPSTHYSPLYYAPWTIWSKSNATNGDHALNQILASSKPLAQTVAVSQPAP